MTRIELLVFMVAVSMGSYLTGVLVHVGGLWLAIPGFYVGFIFLPVLGGGAYAFYRKWAYYGDHRMPCCICGSREFRVETKVKSVSGSFYDSCRLCGRRHEKRLDKVFMIEDGLRKPYMNLAWRRGWVETTT